MLVKDIIDVDFVNYKLPSMFIALGKCDFKCCKEQNLPISTCQNSATAQQVDIDISIDRIVDKYVNNEFSLSIVIGGLEPMLQFYDVLNLIKALREKITDDIVIYTGYYEYEIRDYIEQLSKYKNIIMKFGRYVPNQNSHLDIVLGVELASDNQYGKKIS